MKEPTPAMKHVLRYLHRNPGASFARVRSDCYLNTTAPIRRCVADGLVHRDGSRNLAALDVTSWGYEVMDSIGEPLS
jgi:hypothetical protein